MRAVENNFYPLSMNYIREFIQNFKGLSYICEKIKMRALFTILLVALGIQIYSQDTIRLMQYNLLMYGNNFGGCTSGNNNVNDKNGYLKTIVDYVQPDIVLVNEIYEDEAYHDLILNDVFNTDGINYWNRGNPNNLANSFIVNEVFYNSLKFEVTNYVAVQTNVRDIDIYRFSILPSSKSGRKETVELNCAVAHLKAGSDNENVVERAYETNKLMNYLNNSGSDGNYTFSGDFNLYSGSEQAMQNLLNYANPDIRFYDPINQIGNWNNNSFYANIHTQSTHVSGDCFSGGGMDDRFDFFMISEEIKDGTDDIEYLEGSYHAVGQDGEHFNNTLISSPTNTSVPGNVLNALYNMSDHLPVVVDLVVNNNLGIDQDKFSSFNFTFQNPVQSYLNLKIIDQNAAKYKIEILNSLGIPVYTTSYHTGNGKLIHLNLSKIKAGIYLLRVGQFDGSVVVKKLVIQ